MAVSSIHILTRIATVFEYQFGLFNARRLLPFGPGFRQERQNIIEKATKNFLINVRKLCNDVVSISEGKEFYNPIEYDNKNFCHSSSQQSENFIDLPLFSLSCNTIDTLNIKLTEPGFHTSTEVDLIEIDAFWKFVIPNVSGQIIQSALRSDSKDLLCNEDFQAYDSYEEVIEFNESNEKYVCDDELQYIRTQQCI
ncbi:hypothetical protein HZH66_010496 [Vespula vulgaris]|uniref:Uncharacterized protein n=1 Tax=Vespula vulgaris TaxID=7454 RepID=A0A834MZE6_VESVU|nr:hypothetical protein HZH66_010496 [Vespula vulgaris]